MSRVTDLLKKDTLSRLPSRVHTLCGLRLQDPGYQSRAVIKALGFVHLLIYVQKSSVIIMRLEDLTDM